MKALLIGGTGLISRGIVKHLLARGAEITVFNRGRRDVPPGPGVKALVGDRNDFVAFENTFSNSRFDVVIDMICFNSAQAISDVRAFGQRCGHFIFCSTVCTYGVKIPPGVIVDETFGQEPISEYGKNKLACEKIFLAAHDDKKFDVTILRPASTHGPGNPLIDHLEANPVAWDRIQKGLPVLCGGDGLNLWTTTHRNDCGKLFAFAAMNPRAFGQSYNATREQIFTWRDYYGAVAGVLGTTAKLLFMPSRWIAAHDRKRFQLLDEITQYHGPYTSAKAKRDIPEFTCEIDFPQGAAETLDDIRRRNAWRSSEADATYEAMVEKAITAGVEPVAV